MDIRQLQYVRQIVRSQSFTKAAAELHVTQPSISKAISNLEVELGVQLFVRTGRQILLTDAGRIIYEQSHEIIKTLDEIDLRLSGLTELQKGALSIGLPPMVGAYFFPEVIGKFRDRYPGISLRILENGSKRIEAAVADGELDVGVVLLPVSEETFDMFPFVEERLQLLLPNAHALACRSSVRLEELAGESFILFREDFTLHDRILLACREAGFEPKVFCESSQWDFISGMVAAGLGIAMLPETICANLDPRNIRVVDLSDPIIPWRLAMVWRRSGYLSYAGKEWIRFTRELLCLPEIGEGI